MGREAAVGAVAKIAEERGGFGAEGGEAGEKGAADGRAGIVEQAQERGELGGARRGSFHGGKARRVSCRWQRVRRAGQV